MIERDDLAGASALQVSETSSIIDADVVFSDDPGTQPTIKIANGVRFFEMEFLRPYDGIILKVDHTGEPNELFVEMKTKAGGPIKKVSPVARAVMWLTSYVGSMCLLAYVTLLVFPAIAPREFAGGPISMLFFSMFLGMFTGSVFGLFIITPIAIFTEVIRKRRGVSKRAKRIFNQITANAKGALR